MNEDKRTILELLASGKISQEQADQLLEALGGEENPQEPEEPAPEEAAGNQALAIEVDDEGQPVTVNMDQENGAVVIHAEKEGRPVTIQVDDEGGMVIHTKEEGKPVTITLKDSPK